MCGRSAGTTCFNMWTCDPLVDIIWGWLHATVDCCHNNFSKNADFLSEHLRPSIMESYK